VRIMLLATSMGMGGADKQILSAADELRRRGHQVLIVSLTPLGPMGVQARNQGIRVESLEMRRGIPDPRGMIRLVRLVRSWKPDVLHSHMVHANLMARALRLFVRVPALISTIHSIKDGGRLRMAAYRLSNRLVDRMTIVSQAAADRFVAEGTIPRELLRVVPNGVDVHRFQEVASRAREPLRRSLGLQREFVWLAVGRFAPAKDYPNMLKGFAQVHKAHPDSVLLLVGRGALQGEAEALVLALGLATSVRFLGPRHDVPELMSAADGYVLSSAWEGMPVVLLEAAAAGLPIVATSVGGNREVVRDRESGYLVPPQDPDALGLAMRRLMGMSEAQRRSMGHQGREHVQANYGLSRVVDRWESLYHEVLAAKGITPAERPAPVGDRRGGSHAPRSGSS
jgi:glycosyltransferase involved in cell wall biosynthesis